MLAIWNVRKAGLELISAKVRLFILLKMLWEKRMLEYNAGHFIGKERVDN